MGGAEPQWRNVAEGTYSTVESLDGRVTYSDQRWVNRALIYSNFETIRSHQIPDK